MSIADEKKLVKVAMQEFMEFLKNSGIPFTPTESEFRTVLAFNYWLQYLVTLQAQEQLLDGIPDDLGGVDED